MIMGRGTKVLQFLKQKLYSLSISYCIKQQNPHKLAPMKIHTMGAVTAVLLLIGSISVVMADDKKEVKDPLTEKYATKEKEIGVALKSGLISKDLAEKILNEYERQLKADQRRGQFRNRQAGRVFGEARDRADKAREDARARMEEKRKNRGPGWVFRNGTTTSSDGKGGRYTITVSNGEKRFKAEGGGALLFDGPVDTEKQRETLDTKKVYEGLVNAKQKPAQTKATAAATALTKALANKTFADKAQTEENAETKEQAQAKAAEAAKALTDKTLADKALTAANAEVAKAKTTFDSASFSAPDGNLLKKLEQMEEGRVGNRAAAFRGRWEEKRKNQGQAFDPFARQRLGGFNGDNPFKELNLTEEQQKKIAAIRLKQSEEQLEYSEMMKELDETYQKRMEGLLTDEQRGKYKEMQSQQDRRPPRGR